MLKIQIKGKHIFISLAIFLLLFCAAYTVAPGILYDRAAALAGQGKNELADRYYELIINRFPRSDEAVRALFFTAQREAGQDDGSDIGYINIFPAAMWGGSSPGSPERLHSAITKFELLRERYPDSPWAKHALHEIGQAYYHLGEYDQAAEYLNASVAASEMGKAESVHLLAEIYRLRGDYESALALISRSQSERPDNDALGMQHLKGRVLLDLGRLDEAREAFAALPEMAAKLFNAALIDERADVKEENITHWEDLAARYLQSIDRLIRAEGETGTVTGRVIRNGNGLAGVRVYLIDRALYGDYASSLTEGLPQLITDAEGKFVFTGLLPGQYDLGIGLKAEDLAGHTLRQDQAPVAVAAGRTVRRDLELIPTVRLVSPLAGAAGKDSIAFVWEPVADAARYDLFWGPVTRAADGSIVSQYTYVWRSGIEGTTVTVDLAAEAARDRFTGRISYDDVGIDPLSVLGPLYVGGELTWGVYAYDAAGNRINDSLGCSFILRDDEIPSFTLPGQTLTVADRLLLGRQYAAASAAYEAALAQNPRDTHSLLALARLYHLGWRTESTDPARAAGYYERFLTLEDIPEARQALAECYFRLGEDEKAYAEYSDLAAADPDNWLYRYQMAKIKFIAGEPEAALALLRDAVDLPDGKYLRAYPVAVSLLLEDGASALAFARQVDGGADYLPLLRDYLVPGYRLPAEAARAIRAGEYEQALKLLGNSSHDRFIAILLTYANSRQYDYDELNRMTGAVGPDGPARLLRLLLNLGL